MTLPAPERRRALQFLVGFGDSAALPRHVVGDGSFQAGVGEVVRRPGGDRAIAARQLVLALRAGLDAGEAAFDGEVDRLVVAELEMQEGMVLEAAPVASVEGVSADEVEGPGDRAA